MMFGSCCGCKVTNSTGPKTEFSGVWTPGTSGSPSEGNVTYQTPSSNAVLCFDNSVPTSQAWNAYVYTDTTIVVLAGTLGVLRIIGGFLDVNNYVFAEWEFEQVSTGIGAAIRSQLRLGKVLAGVSSTLARHPHSSIATLAGTMGSTLNGIRLQLSWDGLTLFGHVLGVSPHHMWIAARNVTMPGGKFGIGTGTLTNVTSVLFRRMYYERGESISYPSCAAGLVHCCQGNVPQTVLVELSGTPVGYHNFGFRIPCTNLLGTYTLANVDPYVETLPPAFDGSQWGGDGAFYDATAIQCIRWEMVATIAGEVFDGASWVPSTFDCEVTLEIDEDGLTRFRIRYFQNFGGFPPLIVDETIVEATHSLSTPCEEWVDWLDLTPAGSMQCALTIRFKKS